MLLKMSSLPSLVLKMWKSCGMLGRLTWRRRTTRERMRHDVHVPPGMSVWTMSRAIEALRKQGKLIGDPEDEWFVIPLVSSRHSYHKEHKDL